MSEPDGHSSFRVLGNANLAEYASMKEVNNPSQTEDRPSLQPENRVSSRFWPFSTSIRSRSGSAHEGRDIAMYRSYETAEDWDREPDQDHPNLEQADLTVQRLETVDNAIQNAAIAAALTLFAILGCLTRIAVYKLGNYDGYAVYPDVVVQAIGCSVMGIVVRNKRMLESYDVSLFLGLGTAFCGSVTTFSSWMYDVFIAFDNGYQFNHNGVKNVADAFTQIMLTVSVATSGLRFGVHTSTLLVKLHLIPRVPLELPESKEGKAKHKKYRRIYHICLISIGFAVWLAVILISAFYKPWRRLCLALVVAPIGCYIRYLLSITLNPVSPAFPVGTFSANMIATAFLSMLQVVQQHHATKVDSTGCDMAQAFVDGYCGCLSTVSTFATEIRGMRRYHAYRYAVVSVVCGQVLVVLIFGTYLWTHGSDGHCYCKLL